jgi:broad specificity phosphatase PhoE
VIDQLILVRHGETVHNVAGIAQGWNDSALSTAGEEQVLRLAERLAVQDIGAIFSSPLSRAMATARAIAAATGLQIHTVDELREMNYGQWEGRAFHEVRRDDASAYEQWIADPDAACPNGESHNDLRKRLDRAFQIIGVSASNGGPKASAGRIVIVTHGTAIRVAATALLDLPVMASRHFAQDNASMNVFAWRGDRYVLKAWNDTTHCT